MEEQKFVGDNFLFSPWLPARLSAVVYGYKTFFLPSCLPSTHGVDGDTRACWGTNTHIYKKLCCLLTCLGRKVRKPSPFLSQTPFFFSFREGDTHTRRHKTTPTHVSFILFSPFPEKNVLAFSPPIFFFLHHMRRRHCCPFLASELLSCSPPL